MGKISEIIPVQRIYYVNQCQAFITNDKSLKGIPDIEVIILSDIAALLASNK
ncbi:hypothetical protein BGP_2848 [Beggiatoa sp. PS]|nr:hypothetical protein BGP_2848 [Beggiatoa sp. PS]